MTVILAWKQISGDTYKQRMQESLSRMEEFERKYQKEWETRQRAEAAESWFQYQEIERRVRSAFA